MGQAKWRKENDPNFGRIPKVPLRRGLIVCPPIEIQGTKLHLKSNQLDPEELRFAVLFWDRLVWPSSKALFIESGPDAKFLEAAGVLSRPNYTFSGDMAQGFAQSQIQAYLDNDKKEPGAWALAQGENSLLLSDGLVEDGKGVVLSLHRAIPIPKHEVPLQEILEFKQRRNNELMLLRRQLDSFAIDIENSSDQPDALNARVLEIDKACSDLATVSKEWQFPVTFCDVSTSFNFEWQKFYKGAKDGAAYGAGIGLTIGLPTTGAIVGGALGGANTTFNLKSGFGFRSPRRPMSPYRYVARIHQDLA